MQCRIVGAGSSSRPCGHSRSLSGSKPSPSPPHVYDQRAELHRHEPLASPRAGLVSDIAHEVATSCSGRARRGPRGRRHPLSHIEHAVLHLDPARVGVQALCWGSVRFVRKSIRVPKVAPEALDDSAQVHVTPADIATNGAKLCGWLLAAGPRRRRAPRPSHRRAPFSGPSGENRMRVTSPRSVPTSTRVPSIASLRSLPCTVRRPTS